MPIWIPVAIGAGLASGWAIDQVFGDGNYTAREAAIDATTGALGGGVLVPGVKILARTRRFYKHKDAVKAGQKADWTTVPVVVGATLAPAASKAVRREAVGTITAGYVYDHFIESPGDSPQSYQQGGTPGGTGFSRPLPEYVFKTHWELPKGTKTEAPVRSSRMVRSKNGRRRSRTEFKCAPGWKLAKVGRSMRCIKLP